MLLWLCIVFFFLLAPTVSLSLFHFILVSFILLRNLFTINVNELHTYESVIDLKTCLLTAQSLFASIILLCFSVEFLSHCTYISFSLIRCTCVCVCVCISKNDRTSLYTFNDITEYNLKCYDVWQQTINSVVCPNIHVAFYETDLISNDKKWPHLLIPIVFWVILKLINPIVG